MKTAAFLIFLLFGFSTAQAEETLPKPERLNGLHAIVFGLTGHKWAALTYPIAPISTESERLELAIGMKKIAKSYGIELTPDPEKIRKKSDAFLALASYERTLSALFKEKNDDYALKCLAIGYDAGNIWLAVSLIMKDPGKTFASDQDRAKFADLCDKWIADCKAVDMKPVAMKKAVKLKNFLARAKYKSHLHLSYLLFDSWQLELYNE